MKIDYSDDPLGRFFADDSLKHGVIVPHTSKASGAEASVGNPSLTSTTRAKIQKALMIYLAGRFGPVIHALPKEVADNLTDHIVLSLDATRREGARETWEKVASDLEAGMKSLGVSSYGLVDKWRVRAAARPSEPEEEDT